MNSENMSDFFENKQYLSHIIKKSVRQIQFNDISVTNSGKTFLIKTSNLNELSEFIKENKIKVKLNDVLVEAVETMKERLLKS